MTKLVFVTPAWQRYDLTAVCLEQRKRVCDDLKAQGIEATCVVVTDDANMVVARTLGFEAFEQDNRWLGRKFNDGMECAARLGADWIVPIGSDSWIDPNYFIPLPDPSETRTSSNYCAVTDTKLGELRSRDTKGIGPYMFHRSLLEGCRFRPAADTLNRSIDRSTIQGITAPIHWVERSLHPFQYVGFRGFPTISPYEVLFDKLGVREYEEPWHILSEYYPVDLVHQVRHVLKEQYING